jgi:hypothetical protein
MARESREVWVKRVERWRESGLTAAEFAAEVGINAGSLRHWSWRVDAERRRQAALQRPSEDAVTFVEVATSKVESELTAAGPRPSPCVEEKFTRDRQDAIYRGELGIMIGTV